MIKINVLIIKLNILRSNGVFIVISMIFAVGENYFMEIKLILSDLDETLLHSDKSISDYSVRIFEQCRQRGILVGFCTSRGKSNIIPFEKKINPDICIS